jgi:hypothetical protein
MRVIFERPELAIANGKEARKISALYSPENLGSKGNKRWSANFTPL